MLARIAGVTIAIALCLPSALLILAPYAYGAA